MEKSYSNSSETEVGVLVTPITTFLGKRKYLYTLPGSAYGEWIIFENNEPRYYFYAFDTLYIDLYDKLKASGNVDAFLKKSFEKLNVNLSTHQNITGIKHEKEAIGKLIVLEKLPVSFISNNNE